jgi:hypothetical protein
MTCRVGSPRIAPWRAAFWRSQRGEVVVTIIALGGVLGAALAGMVIGASITERDGLLDCIKRVDAATKDLQATFPGGGSVPLDDPRVRTIKGCQAFLESVAQGTSVGVGPGVKNLRDLINKSTARVGACYVQSVYPGAPKAGVDTAIEVYAQAPFRSSLGSGVARLTVRGQQFVGNLFSVAGRNDVQAGAIAVPRNVSESAAGEASELVVTLTGPIGPPIQGQCLDGTLQGGQCVVSCTTGPKAVVWKAPPLPDIKLFLAAPSTIDKVKPTPVALVWSVKDATSVTIDQGVGEVAGQGQTVELPPDQDTIYTLTAVGARPQDIVKATQKVTVTDSTPFAITLTVGSGNEVTTDSTITVGGKVTPTPPPGTVVAVGVNGVPVTQAAVDGGGSYFATVTLTKISSSGKLTLSNPARSLTVCGSHPPSIVTLFNTASPAEVQNVINATVLKTGAPDSNIASLTITHAVRLTGARVIWSGACSGANETFAVGGKILRPGESLQVGTIPCGLFPCPGFTGTCSPVARVTVDTSVGFLFADAVWAVKVE